MKVKSVVGSTTTETSFTIREVTMSDTESNLGSVQEKEPTQDENPSSKPLVEAEEMEDLFGDESGKDSGSENDEEVGLKGDGDEEQHSGAEDDEQAMYNRKFYGENAGNSDGEGSEGEFREADVDVVKHIVPYSTAPVQENEGQKGLFYAKMPQFLSVDPVPFDPPAFQDKVEQRAAQSVSKEDQIGDRLIDENTVRWRYSRDSNQRVYKESNAQVVQWSDGTYSLRLGDEYTDVLINDIDNTYLAVSHEQQELIQSAKGGEISSSMIFIPTSTNSKSHQRLSKAVARKEQREHQGPNTYILRVDPELEQRELEKKQGQIIRERRKRQLREQQEREGLGSPEPSGLLAKQRGGSSSKSGLAYDGSRYDEYEDDGFMVDDEEDDNELPDDEEEDEEDVTGESDDDDAKADRLRQLKRSGESHYREEEAESNADDDASSLKRRKVAILDDDED
ncbi:LADA_0B03532g1_1 [Lachancea dasiensis]|uniref:LADA_0B03532g1_1 n=1 Tax=Lachancea dasiensis TaxID=1072105 RepID=A0A1G4ISG7_9SACH|nr:LADA_0B03532g1_1 [Lachancea dasiensis]